MSIIRKRISVVLLFLCITIQGCAVMGEKRIAQITSEPAGAKAYFYQPINDSWFEIGVTPTNYTFRSGLWEIFLYVEKPGHETQYVFVPNSGDVTHHFILERDFTIQINEEAPKLNKEFKKDVARLLGTFDKALNSPRMLASSVVSEARTQLQELILDYPE